MSSVAVTDKRGGIFEVVMTFTYGECDRLPYNALRKVNARIEQVKNGGIKATADFNLRNKKEAANFVEVLDLFGEDGSFVHGSPAPSDVLKLESPPEEEEESDGERAAAGNKRSAGGEDTAAPPPPGSARNRNTSAADPAEAEADGLEVETEEEVEIE